MKPKVFIGSSVEGLSIAYAIQENLTHDAEVTVWSQGIFELSKTTMESLEKTLNKSDFGIFVFSPDDEIKMRGNQSASIRDNVLFELGLFIGQLGRDRTFFIIPSNNELHIPTDLLGITPAKYETDRDDDNFIAGTGVACSQIRKQIKHLGKLRAEEKEESIQVNTEKEDFQDSWGIDFINGEFESAKIKLEKIIADSSSDVSEDKISLAYIIFKIDQSEGLKKLYELADEYNNDFDAQTFIARVFLWIGHTKKSIELVENLLAINPNNERLVILLADCHKSTGELDNAIDLLVNHHSSKNPEMAIALSVNYEEIDELDKALSIIHSVYIEFPNDDIRFKYSQLLEKKCKYKESLCLLNDLTINNPKEVKYWGYLGNCCISLDLYDNAMIAYQKASELSQNQAGWIFNNIGNIMNNKCFYTEAISWLKKGLELDPNSQYSCERLGQAMKNKEEERKKFNNHCKEGRKLIRGFSIE